MQMRAISAEILFLTSEHLSKGVENIGCRFKKCILPPDNVELISCHTDNKPRSVLAVGAVNNFIDIRYDLIIKMKYLCVLR